MGAHAWPVLATTWVAKRVVGRGDNAQMADVLYVALMIGVFLLLALTMRGMERL